MPSLKASMFFNNGVMARTERLVLRSPQDDDLMKYIDAFGGPNPFLAREYRRDEALRQLYWEGVMTDENSLYCSICTKDGNEFIGYCTIEKLGRKPPEVGINLLKGFQAQGFGPEAMTALMAAFQRISGTTAFIAEIEPDNAHSQKMFRRLGFVPKGIDTFIIKDPEELERFEQKQLEELGGIPEELQALARELNVEPRKLLSHVLVFERAND